jgi:hypothetical protein
MRIILDLPQELERELSLEAAQLGLPLAEYVRRLLATGRIVGNIPKTGAELMAYWQNEGLIGTRPDIADSKKHAREIRAAAEKRTRA